MRSDRQHVKHKHRFFTLLLCFLLLLPFAKTAWGIEAEVYKTDPIVRGDGFSAVLYNNTNGLPTSEANAIAETDSGFIWIGSYSGLIRYDGNDFERMDSTNGIASVTSLYVDRLDRLWIGTNDNGVAVMKDGTLQLWDKQAGLPAASVRAITEDEQGLIYVATTGGLVMIDQEMNLCFPEDERLYGIQIDDLQIGNDGLIYGLSNIGDIFTLRDGNTEVFIDHTENPLAGVRCIYPDPKNPGMVYFDTDADGVYYGMPGESADNLKKIDITPLDSVNQFQYINDQLWVCANNGIGILDKDGMHQLANIPLNNSIGQAMMDYEGNMWFTSTRQGVMKIVRNRFLDLYERCWLEPAVVNTTCMYQDKLFIGTDTGLAILDGDDLDYSAPVSSAETASGEKLEITNLFELLAECRIRSIVRDSKDRLWISTWRACGLLCYDQGRLTVYTESDGLPSDHVRTVVERRDGSFLVAAAGGVSVIENGKITRTYSEQDGLLNTEILTVAEGTNGDILTGTDGGGMFVIRDGSAYQIGAEGGLSSDVVMRIKPDPKRNIFWIVTSNSIAFMDAGYQVTTVQDFPYSNNFDLYENSKEDMWVLSSNGVYVVPTEELLANEDIVPLYYDKASGLPCITTANSYSELTEDGDLYIAGSTGVAKVNIDASFEDVNDLKMSVPYIDADNERIFPDEAGNFTIDPDVRRLTIYGYVFRYSLINPQVSYRLEGLDKEEITVSCSELDPVDYTNLPGGTYHFEMQLHDPMGGESNVQSVKIVKTKAIYEHLWFYSLCFLLALFCIIVITRLYVKKRMAYLEKKHREEAEKERITGELKMGAAIQKSMLPANYPAFPDRKEFDVFATMDPAKEVGGDFYDFFLIDEDHLGLVVADVSGKGIPAALYMMISKTILQSCAMLGKSAAETLTLTNEAICSNNKTEMFITVWFGILEISTGTITAANAGHEYPAVKNGDSFTLLKDKHGLVIGGMEESRYKEYTLQLEPGDKLFVYSDGVPEATNAEEELFGTDRMMAALNRAPEDPPQTILANVRAAVDDFVGDAEQFDDLTMLCLEYKGCEQ